MKMTKRDVVVTINFENLECGDVFRYDDAIYMVIEEISKYNAVNLDDGTVVHFDDYDAVVELDNAELVY